MNIRVCIKEKRLPEMPIFRGRKGSFFVRPCFWPKKEVFSLKSAFLRRIRGFDVSIKKNTFFTPENAGDCKFVKKFISGRGQNFRFLYGDIHFWAKNGGEFFRFHVPIYFSHKYMQIQRLTTILFEKRLTKNWRLL